MITASQIPGNAPDAKETIFILVSIILVAFGFRYVKELVSLVLEKLYEIFIQQNPLGI